MRLRTNTIAQQCERMGGIVTNDLIDIPVAVLAINPDVQPRIDGLDGPYAHSLESVLELLPPITVVIDNGTYIPVDGMHRIAAHQNVGVETIKARVVPMPSDGDLLALAFGLNAKHGRPLTLTDRRTFAARQLKRDAATSNLEIARTAGLSPTTVATIRERLEQSAAIEPAEQRVARDGTAYRVTGQQPRPAGELPPMGFGESVGQAFSSKDRRQQRQVVSYLQRLEVALNGQFELEGFESLDDALMACQLVLGQEGAEVLADRLGPGVENVLAVACGLGYEPDGDA